MKKRYCTIKELSVYTGFPTGTLYEWASIGVIPSIKIRKRVLFDLEDFDSAMDKLKRNPFETKSAVEKSTITNAESGYHEPDSGHRPIKPRKGG